MNLYLGTNLFSLSYNPTLRHQGKKIPLVSRIESAVSADKYRKFSSIRSLYPYFGRFWG
jgi:hypothetical protein